MTTTIGIVLPDPVPDPDPPPISLITDGSETVELLPGDDYTCQNGGGVTIDDTNWAIYSSGFLAIGDNITGSGTNNEFAIAELKGAPTDAAVSWATSWSGTGTGPTTSTSGAILHVKAEDSGFDGTLTVTPTYDSTTYTGITMTLTPA